MNLSVFSSHSYEPLNTNIWAHIVNQLFQLFYFLQTIFIATFISARILKFNEVSFFQFALLRCLQPSSPMLLSSTYPHQYKNLRRSDSSSLPCSDVYNLHHLFYSQTKLIRTYFSTLPDSGIDSLRHQYDFVLSQHLNT